MKTVSGPATIVAAVTPHDTNTLAPCTALYIGGAGNVKLTAVDGGTVTFVGLAAGTILPVAASVVFNTDTTATSIIALA